jgi:hypothetical protein
MFGIELTQKEELRKKQFIRLFVEERIVELGEILLYFGSKACDVVDFLYNTSRESKRLIVTNKAYAAALFFALTVFFAMLW